MTLRGLLVSFALLAPFTSSAISIGVGHSESCARQARGVKIKLVTLEESAHLRPTKILAPWKLDLGSKKGMTFFALMESEIAPTLGMIAREGYEVASADQIIETLKYVSKKVSRSAGTAAGGPGNLRAVGEGLQGQTVTTYNLAEKIKALKIPGLKDPYKLSYFIGLASGGGLALLAGADMTAYNIHYGEGRNPGDERTGRSFGEGPTRLADDSSDKSYLQALEELVRAPRFVARGFFGTIMRSLTNCDLDGVEQLSKRSRDVLADFYAIYAAEADRHLMSDLKRHPWDEALLEVTLLSAFHARQDKIMVMFNGLLTDTVPHQQPGGEPRDEMRAASLIDWWQFSSNPDPKSKNRSGINVTRRDFRKLGAFITRFMRENHPDLVKSVEAELTGVAPGDNLFASLSVFLISFKTPSALGDQAYRLSDAMTAFLAQVSADGQKITDYILVRQRPKAARAS